MTLKRDAVWKVLQPQWERIGIISTFTSSRISASSNQIWGNLCGGNGMNVLSYPNPQLFKVFKHLIYVWHRCGMQFKRFYPLNDSVVGSFPHLHHIWFQRTFPNLRKPLCGGNGVSVLPYAHPQLFKVFKHLIYVWHGCGMQFERFYTLNDSIVGSFPHWHHLGFQ
jgi:hypothetical protein